MYDLQRIAAVVDVSEMDHWTGHRSACSGFALLMSAPRVTVPKFVVTRLLLCVTAIILRASTGGGG
jgi:hypothetical protein